MGPAVAKPEFREHIVGGIENTVRAFRTLFAGENKGKLMMRLADRSDRD
jgi:NADPH-dependent curcumin reductase CurA